LHAAAVAVHCATQAPDNPQFCEQEKLLESQLATHSAKVRDCATRIPPIGVAPPAVADITSATSATNLIGSRPGAGVRRFRKHRNIGGFVCGARLGIGARLDHAVRPRYRIVVRRDSGHERE
jgi:hypothetical protein